MIGKDRVCLLYFRFPEIIQTDWLKQKTKTFTNQKVKARRRKSALEEAVSGGVEDPWVLLGALLTRVQSQGLAWQLPRAHGTRVGQRAQLVGGRRDCLSSISTGQAVMATYRKGVTKPI